MLKILKAFRKTLSNAMLPAMHRRVILYGYGYTGRFLKWYAEYYHNIKVDYIISCDMRTSQSYEEEIFRPSLLGFDYKDSQNAIIWLAVPLDDLIANELKKYNFIDGINLVNFHNLVYGKDILWDETDEKSGAYTRKTGIRDIHFLEWLEWKYDCNFVTTCVVNSLPQGCIGYKVSTQKRNIPSVRRMSLGGGNRRDF